MDHSSRKDQWFPDPAGLVLAESILLYRTGNSMHMSVPIYDVEYKCDFITRDLKVAFSVLLTAIRTREGERKRGVQKGEGRREEGVVSA